MAAFLGVSGSGPAWLVKSVEVSGKKIRLVYEWVGTKANDSHPYFVWIPLEKLQPGAYTLELFDQRRNHVALFRTVTVTRK